MFIPFPLLDRTVRISPFESQIVVCLPFCVRDKSAILYKKALNHPFYRKSFETGVANDFPIYRSGWTAICLSFFIPFLDFVSGCSGNPDAKRLYDDLLSNYNKLVRPVVNVTDALTVKIKLKLSQLIDVVSFTLN